MARTASRRKASKPAARRPAAAAHQQPRVDQPRADPPEERALYSVVDELAKLKTRTHEAWVTRKRGDGRREKVLTSFAMAPGTPLPVTKEVALQFAKLATFTVRTPSGARIKPADPKQSTDGKVKLGPGQVVADVDELTADALLKRARLLPGGNSLPASPKRSDLVDFVLAGGADEDGFVEDDFEIEDDVEDDAPPPRPSAGPRPARRPAAGPDQPATAADIARAAVAGVEAAASGEAPDVDDGDGLDDDDLPED